jgi:hypothetical protein
MTITMVQPVTTAKPVTKARWKRQQPTSDEEEKKRGRPRVEARDETAAEVSINHWSLLYLVILLAVISKQCMRDKSLTTMYSVVVVRYDWHNAHTEIAKRRLLTTYEAESPNFKAQSRS